MILRKTDSRSSVLPFFRSNESAFGVLRSCLSKLFSYRIQLTHSVKPYDSVYVTECLCYNLCLSLWYYGFWCGRLACLESRVIVTESIDGRKYIPEFALRFVRRYLICCVSHFKSYP